jgi:hypothetical protein
MKNISLIISGLISMIALSACQKDKHHVSVPTVHVHQPVTGTTYNAGDTVPIKIHFSDDDDLHEYHIKLTNKTENVDVLELDGHEHGTSYEVDTYVVVSATVHADYVLTAEVSNHNGEEAEATIAFHVHP